MNKIKILPLLLIFPVLASCSGKLKAPTFADYGEKQNFTSFSPGTSCQDRTTEC